MMRGFPQDVVLLGGFAILVTVVAARMSLMVIALCIAIAFKAMPLLRHLFAGEPGFMEILPALSATDIFIRARRGRSPPRIRTRWGLR